MCVDISEEVLKIKKAMANIEWPLNKLAEKDMIQEPVKDILQ